MCPVPFLPPSPPLPDCYVGHPLPSVPVLLCPPCQPGAPVERQGRLGAPARARQQEPRASASVWPGCPVCPCAPGCPGLTPVRHHTCRNVPASIPWCFHAALGCRLLPSSVSLCPAELPTLLLARAEAASGLPSTASLHPASCSRSLPGSLCGRPFCLGVLYAPPPSRMACDAAGPSGHLGHVCEFVAPLPAAAWGLLLSVHCPAFSISVSPPPPSWRVVPSTPLDLTRTVAPAVDFPVTVPDGRHTVFYRKAAVVPAPFSFVPLSRFFQTVWCSVCKSIILRIAFVNIFVNILVLSLIIFDIFMTWL
ncbi:uncharacterized protein LOC116644367 [Phoca vitulina]|uniref:uncharacterized protein LOC116644367 n=1 Tax=Phoca vitulina TaxID=9720 RepID=UPI0013960F9B|nr:uncharacterized protein LOC116644367 [Phoca vitulina]